MERKTYPTDLTDQEWALVKEILDEYTQSRTTHKGGRPALNSKKDYLDALFYVLRTGCSWRTLPHDFPKWQSVYTQFRRWQEQGIFKLLPEKFAR
jgi:transposase